MESNSVNCLFCALPCSPDFLINKSDNVTSSSPSFELGGEDAIIEENLKAIFILKKILKIPKETLCQFLGKGSGQFYPELWFNVCESCGESVSQFYGILKQISKLERKLVQIQTKLKGRIEESKDVENNDVVWDHIRSEALNNGLSLSPPRLTEDLRISPSPTKKPEVKTITIKIKTEFNSGGEEEEDNDGDHEGFLPENPTRPHPTKVSIKKQNPTFFDDDDDDYHPPTDPLGDHSPSSSDYEPDDDDISNEEEEVEFLNDSNISPPVIKTKEIQSDITISNSTPLVKRSKIYFYACSKCSFQSNTKSDFEAHLLLHEAGSGAITCGDCGRPVLPKKMKLHRHQHINILAGYHKFRPMQLSNLKENDADDTSSAAAASTNLSSAGRYYYQCNQCPYETNSTVNLRKHLHLHQEGSNAVTCSNCGLLIHPQKFRSHWKRRHSHLREKYKVQKNNSGKTK